MPDRTTPVLLALGANLGDRASTLRRAVDLLGARALTDVRASAIYATEPVGYTNQPDFLNMAVAGATALDAMSLSDVCRSIERELGRTPRAKWHEREIDIDVLLYGAEVIETPALQIPHPRMHERRFVLRPAADVAPTMYHPTLGATVTELLDLCQDTSRVDPL